MTNSISSTAPVVRVRCVLPARTRHVHRRVARRELFLLLLLLLVGPIDAQDGLDAVLVQDINTTPSRLGLMPRDVTVVGSKLFFRESFGGLWVTDGTVEGSIPLPISDAPLEGSPLGLADAGGTLYFSAVDETGRELWKSDGTPAGTVRVKDINPSVNPLESSSPGGFVALGDTVLFVADDGVHGRALWETDGTDAGTSMVAEIPGGLPSGLVPVGDLVLFLVRTSINPLHEDLWRSDGTTAGTFLVKDVNPGGVAGLGPITVFDGKLFFTVTDGSERKLWESDGTAAGTVDLGIDGTINLRSAARVNGVLYFLSNRDAVPGVELWKIDLVSAAAEPLSDINWIISNVGAQVQNLTPVGDVLYLTGDDGTTGDELWKHDLSTGMTEPVTDFNPAMGAQSFLFGALVDVEGKLFFPGGPISDRQIWTSDGTDAGTVEITIHPDGFSFPYSYQPVEILSFDGSLFFSAVGEPFPELGGVGGGPEELWRTDGTDAGTVELRLGGEITLDSEPQLVNPPGAGGGGVVVGSVLFFSANDHAFTDDSDDPQPDNLELWKSDGTECGTVRVADINPDLSSFPLLLTEVSGLVYFIADDGTNGFELWRHDPATDVTERVTDINPGGGHSIFLPMNIVRFGELLFFPAFDGMSIDLWRHDTTTGATGKVADAVGYEIILLGGAVIFTSGGGMWRYDIASGVAEQFATGLSFSAQQYAVIGDTLFFKAGPEPALWKTDGTTDGTVEVDPDLNSPLSVNITAFGGSLYYIKGQAEAELWRHDPASDSTGQAADLLSIGLSFPRLLIGFDGRLFFDAYGPGGSSLYAFDPTTDSVEFIADPQPFDNTVPGLLAEPTVVGDTLFFTADPNRSGAYSGFTELWRSDGTPAGTMKVPLSGLDVVRGLVDLNGTLLFAANGPVVGRELYKLGGSAACGEDDDEAPSLSGVLASPNPVFAGEPTVLSATGDDSASGGSTIASASYSVDGGPPMLMDAADGTFDSPLEDVTATLSFEEPGQYELCVTVTDEASNTSDPQCVLLDVIEPDRAAPVVSDVLATPNPVLVDAETVLTAAVDDSQAGDSAIASVSYSVDGGDPLPMDPEDGAFDSPTEGVTASLVFPEPGVYELCLTATDAAGNTSEARCILLAVVGSCEGFVTGGGYILSPRGACTLSPDCAAATGKANFGFVSRHRHATDTPPWGVTLFQFSAGGLRFLAKDYGWLVISGARAIFMGTGQMNGEWGFGFLVEAVDARLTPEDDTDRFGIRIWNWQSGDVIYQSEMPLDGGQIVVHCRSDDGQSHDTPDDGHAGDEDNHDHGEEDCHE